MAATELVADDVNLGREAYDALIKDKALKVRAIMWWFDHEEEQWRLLVATGYYTERGPKAAYRHIRSLLKKSNLLDKLPLRRVMLVESENRLVQLLNMCFKMTAKPPLNIAIEGLTIVDPRDGSANSVDVFIYYMPHTTAFSDSRSAFKKSKSQESKLRSRRKSASVGLRTLS